jgi:hypothetical protein
MLVTSFLVKGLMGSLTEQHIFTNFCLWFCFLTISCYKQLKKMRRCLRQVLAIAIIYAKIKTWCLSVCVRVSCWLKCQWSNFSAKRMNVVRVMRPYPASRHGNRAASYRRRAFGNCCPLFERFSCSLVGRKRMDARGGRLYKQPTTNSGR